VNRTRLLRMLASTGARSGPSPALGAGPLATLYQYKNMCIYVIIRCTMKECEQTSIIGEKIIVTNTMLTCEQKTSFIEKRITRFSYRKRGTRMLFCRIGEVYARLSTINLPTKLIYIIPTKLIYIIPIR
jgi:hypothetical protein